MMQKLVVAGLVGLALAGCNSGSSGSGTGKLNLAFSDAPVDGLTKVCVAFDQISVRHANGGEYNWGTASFSTEQSSDECIPYGYTIPENEYGYPKFMVINLLAYQGDDYLQVLNEESLEAGKYTKLQLHAMADGYYAETETETETTAETEIETEVVSIPYSYVVTSKGDIKKLGYSNANGKIFIHSNFEIYGSATQAYTLEFDLRKGIVYNEPHGYRLKPNAIRMLYNKHVATIEGSVSQQACGYDISDAYIYVYSTPNDGNYAGMYEGDENAPYTTTAVHSSTGEFEIGYVPFGTYDIALICNGSVDNSERDNSAEMNIDYDSVYQNIGLTSENLTITF